MKSCSESASILDATNMILRRFGRKFLALWMIILSQVLVVWFIIHYNHVNSKLVARYEIRDFRFVESREKRNEKQSENSTSISLDSMRSIALQNSTGKQNNVTQVKYEKIATASNNGRHTKLFQTSLRPATELERPTTNKAKPSSKPSIDIVNDYYPFVDFKFVFPEISPNVRRTSNIFLMVLVNSGAKGDMFRKRREAIRQTWGSQNNCEQRKALGDERLKDLRWLLVFVVGKAGPGTNDDELNKAEAKQHNDMLVGNITDDYINNVIKFYMGQVWASRFDITYTLKTDDDVYVRIPRVLEYLVNAKFPRPFYGGMTYPKIRVNREIGGKWTVSWKYYGETHFPKFNPGAFFILSSDLLNKLFNYVYIRKPFHTDDAYVGVAMRDFGVNITTISTFNVRPNMNKFIYIAKDHIISATDGFGHNMDPESNRFLHCRLKTVACQRTQSVERETKLQESNHPVSTTWNWSENSELKNGGN